MPPVNSLFERSGHPTVVTRVTTERDVSAIIRASSAVAETQTEFHIDIWQFRLDLEQDICTSLSAFLSGSEIARAQCFHFAQLQNRYLICHGLMRVLLSGYVGLSPAKISYEFGEHGKPRLAAPFATPGFNLSHSGDLAMLAVGRQAFLGVDVETYRDSIDEQGILRYFSRREANWISSLPANHRRQAFFDSWVRKEAYLKAIGTGLKRPLNSFEIRRNSHNEPWFVVGNVENEHIKALWRIEGLSSPPGSAAAIAYACDKHGSLRNCRVRQFELSFN